MPGRVAAHYPDAPRCGPETRACPGFQHRGWAWIPFRSVPCAASRSPPEFFDEFQRPKDWTEAFHNIDRFGEFDTFGLTQPARRVHRNPLYPAYRAKPPKEWPPEK